MPTTSPHAISYPASSGHPRIWEHIQDTATSVETALTAIGVTSTYTPTWSNATLGTGSTNEGWYTVLGDLVFWTIRVEFGTSPSFSATVNCTLPVTAWTGGSGAQGATAVGSWSYRDNDTAKHWAGTAATPTATGTTVTFNGVWNGTEPSSRIFPGQPFTVAVSDVLTATGVYKKL